MAKLAAYVLSKLNRSPLEIHCWSNSKVALAWFQSHPSKWKTFVSHRVTEITGLLPGAHWRHVKSADNPADLATRGTTPAQLRESSL